jgi:CheY-like chemotaxis protein
MSHEIRTPLTAVLGFTSLLEARGLDETSAAYVQRIAAAGSALLAIVNDILDFSKLEAGRVEVRARPTDVGEIGRETLAMLSARAEEKGLTLRLELDAAAPASVLLDSDRVRQVLLNLAGNAVKFTDAGSVTLRIAPEPAGGALRFEVEDTGPGLSAEQCALLFQRFNQIDGSTTRRHGGTGLGLAICKGLAEAMGGAIGVRSTPGVGSVFHMTLPLAEASAGEAAPGAGDGGKGASIAGLSVMVVDDNPTNRELARRILEAFEAQVTCAEGAAEALALLAATPVDVVLMDLRMPGVDGREALVALRAADGPNQATPVLAFTADAEVGDGAGWRGSTASCASRSTRWSSPGGWRRRWLASLRPQAAAGRPPSRGTTPRHFGYPTEFAAFRRLRALSR